MARREWPLDELTGGIRDGDRRALARAISLVENGDPVAYPLVRELYRELGAVSARFGNPFLTGAGTFYAWLQEPVRPSRRVTRLWMAVHGLRADLQDAFPDPLGTNEEAFAAWTSGSGVHEHGLDAAFLPREEA